MTEDDQIFPKIAAADHQKQSNLTRDINDVDHIQSIPNAIMNDKIWAKMTRLPKIIKKAKTAENSQHWTKFDHMWPKFTIAGPKTTWNKLDDQLQSKTT